ncbi:MAG TPA: ABC transporter permease [Candidatus Acidoferrales bacterium]|nr:ABC transporter permease [Candidatus Acidoferrales bacterium]
MKVTTLRAWFARLGGLFGKERRDRELAEEMESHLQMHIEDNLRAGMSPEEARRQALIRMGGVEQVKETYRDRRGIPWLESLLQDLRFGLRMLRKNPGFAAVAVITLALGIGGTTSVFSIVDRTLFREPPYPNADRLVSFGVVAPIEPREFMLAPEYVVWRAHQTPFEAMTSMMPGGAGCDLTEQNAVHLTCALVEPTFLPTLGVQPILGRNFTHEQGLPHAPRVALVSYGLWRARFGGDPSIVGRSISLDGQPTLVVGVLPETFEMPTLGQADLLIPETLDEGALRRDNPITILRTFAKLKPNVTTAQASSALQPLFQDSLQYVPAQFRNEVRLSVRSLRDYQTRDVRLRSWMLFGAVLAVLLVACANVASLLLARAANRQGEMAVRAALGASGARLVRQTLTESLLLGVMGGAIGCWLAYELVRLFTSIAPGSAVHPQQAALNLRAVSFAAGTSLFCGFFFGLVPALRRPAPQSLTGQDARTTSRGPLRHALVASQIAVSLVLLACTALFLQSLWNLQRAPLGLDAENLEIAQITLAPYRYPQAARQLEFFSELEMRLRQIPGVSSLALSDSLPPSGPMRATIYARIEIAGRAPFAAGTGGMVGWRAVTPEYFFALRIPMLRGRAFTEDDRAPGHDPIILSDSLARRLFAGENPLGHSLRFGLQGPWRIVVGVAANVKNNGLEAQADPEFYIPWKQDEAETSYRTAYIVLRTPLSPETIATWVRTEVASLDTTVPVPVATMGQRVGKLMQVPRFNAVLLSLFAAVAVVLSAIGIYGVVGFLVNERTREIGIRMALGATPRAVLALVLGSMIAWTTAGALAGVLGGWFASRLLRSLVFQIRAHDLWAIGAAVALQFVTVLLACWIPARRAMRVDPMVALRYE